MSLDELGQAMIGTVNRDARCFQTVYEATRRMVYLTCFRVCRNNAAAEDLTADVFGLIWQKAHLWQEGLGSVEAWVGTIARNRAIDWKRQQNNVQLGANDRLHEVPDDGPLIDALLIRAEEYELMRRALRSLPLHQRNAIEAAFFEDMTYSVLAHQFDVPLSTMKTWIRRGLTKMRSQLGLSSETA